MKEALKVAIRAGLWDLAEEISRKNPELRGELEAARKNKKTQVSPGARQEQPMDEALVPFADYVRAGRADRNRPQRSWSALGRWLCCCSP